MMMMAKIQVDLFGKPAPRLISTARFSPCGKFRYSLHRIWDETKPKCMFIGLNPSTADEINDDPTIRRCIRFAKEWGFGGFIMGNIFAYRSTDPRVLKEVNDPIGPDNDKALMDLADEARLVVAAWGNMGVFNGRGDQVRAMIPAMQVLTILENGQPGHPLYLPAATKPKPWGDREK
jgi:hypothetical protein